MRRCSATHAIVARTKAARPAVQTCYNAATLLQMCETRPPNAGELPSDGPRHCMGVTRRAKSTQGLVSHARDFSNTHIFHSSRSAIPCQVGSPTREPRCALLKFFAHYACVTI